MTAVEDVITLLKHEADLAELTVSDVTVGVFYTGVRLNTGHGGVAFTPIHEISEAVCCPKSFGKMPEAGNLSNRPLGDMVEYATSRSAVEATIGVAALNAVSQRLLFERPVSGVSLAVDVDALDQVEIREQDRVAMVGAFTPYVKRLKGKVARLDVLERNPKAAAETAATIGTPQRTLADAVREADILIVTGSSIINQTIDEILAQAKSARERIIVGPTASMLPEPFFKRGATVMGGLRIINANAMLKIVGEAGGAYAMLKHCAQKYSATPT